MEKGITKILCCYLAVDHISQGRASCCTEQPPMFTGGLGVLAIGQENLRKGVA